MHLYYGTQSSKFGSEFVVLRVATELIISLRYKLCMFGISIERHTDVDCDNEPVYKNVLHVNLCLIKNIIQYDITE